MNEKIKILFQIRLKLFDTAFSFAKLIISSFTLILLFANYSKFGHKFPCAQKR